MIRRARRDADAALRRFGRTERGYLDQVRCEALDADLQREGPRSVHRATWRAGGNKARIELGDGTRLDLWLFWPGGGALGSITRVYFQDEVGWMVLARRPSEEPVRLAAFRVRVELPAERRAPSGSRRS